MAVIYNNATILAMLTPIIFFLLLSILLQSWSTLSQKLLVTSSLHTDRCFWTNNNTNALEVYYINMDKSKERNENMINHLKDVGLRHFRVRGLTPGEIYIPLDIESTWRTAQCKTQSDFIPPYRYEANRNISSPMYKMTSIMSGLCGRGKNKNTPKEIGCTTSHLIAMKNAIYSTSARSRYALIIEDDVKFPFDIDFELLASTAPNGFGILQLFNSNKDSMKDSWMKYIKDKTFLWQESLNLKFWSTCAYLIDRVVMKSVIDTVIFNDDKGWLNFKVIAGIQGPCAPIECCTLDAKIFINKPPCVLASFGYQADSFLYAMTKTYMLTVPLISSGKGVDSSTFHQEHVEMFHRPAFRKQRQIMNEMLSGRMDPPAFAKPACKLMLNETES